MTFTKLIICLILIALFLISITGCSEIEKMIDPCKKRFEECNYSCGSGWFSGLCKMDCTDRYNSCERRGG